MNRFLQSSAMMGIALVLAGCEAGVGRVESLRLSPCSAEGSVFAERDFTEWKNVYHDAVNAAVESHMQTMRGVTDQPIACTAENYASVLPPSSALRSIGTMLPAWKDRLDELHESEMSAVLLEFLRVYECSMNEYLETFAISDRSNMTGTLLEQQGRVSNTIRNEEAIAREALIRTLSLTGGFDRLQPLNIDIECLKRASLDVRNTVGLAADVASCMPRSWDIKGSLRDLAE
jgi:hypothetical protein